MTVLLALILAVLVIWFGLWFVGALWRFIEALVQGVVGGLALFWRLVRGSCGVTYRALNRTQRGAFLFDLWACQRAHAAWWSYSYWLKRAYVAMSLRARRRGRHV